LTEKRHGIQEEEPRKEGFCLQTGGKKGFVVVLGGCVKSKRNQEIWWFHIRLQRGGGGEDFSKILFQRGRKKGPRVERQNENQIGGVGGVFWKGVEPVLGSYLENPKKKKSAEQRIAASPRPQWSAYEFCCFLSGKFPKTRKTGQGLAGSQKRVTEAGTKLHREQTGGRVSARISAIYYSRETRYQSSTRKTPNALEKREQEGQGKLGKKQWKGFLGGKECENPKKKGEMAALKKRSAQPSEA